MRQPAFQKRLFSRFSVFRFPKRPTFFRRPLCLRLPLLQKIFTGIVLMPRRKDVPRRRRNFYGLRLFYPQSIKRPAVKCKCPAAKYKTPTAKCKCPAAKHKAPGRNVAAGRQSSKPFLCRKELRALSAEFYLFLLYSSEHTSDSFTPFSASITIM